MKFTWLIDDAGDGCVSKLRLVISELQSDKFVLANAQTKSKDRLDTR
jgi:hypothetical protein